MTGYSDGGKASVSVRLVLTRRAKRNGAYEEELVQDCGGGSPSGCKENAIRVQSAALTVIASEGSERFDTLAGAVEVEEKQ